MPTPCLHFVPFVCDIAALGTLRHLRRLFVRAALGRDAEHLPDISMMIRAHFIRPVLKHGPWSLTYVQFTGVKPEGAMRRFAGIFVAEIDH